MEWMRELWRRARYLFHRREFETDLEDELRFHLDMKQAEHAQRGLTPEAARAQAIQRLGNATLLKEDSRRMWVWAWLEAAAQDSRHAFRFMRKSPGFTLVAVLSLALGLGANTVVFSVLNALLVKPLAIAQPDRVYFVNNSKFSTQSFPNYRDLRDRNRTFESLFDYRMDTMALSIGDQDAQRVWGYLVTGNYFQSLGVQPALGRFFTPAEDMQPGASPYAVLSYACWRNRFAASSDIVGKEIRINSRKYTVLGVAPPAFHGTEVYFWPEVWVPMTMEAQIEPYDWLNSREAWNSFVAGRLKPGISPAQAEADLNGIAAELARQYLTDQGLRLALSPPGLIGSTGRAPIRAFASGVMFLAALVLMAACANLAGLLTARMADRSRDLAVRVSIGAGRGRIARQLLTESLWIALVGGAAGLGIAMALLRALNQWHAPLDFPLQFDVSPDWRVFGFAFAAALLTGLLCGIAPARRAWKADPAVDLKGLAGSARGRFHATTRDILLPFQVALCSLLLIASLVAVRGWTRSLNSPLGFEPDGAAMISYDLGLAGYTIQKGVPFQRRAAEAMARLPGVDSAAYASSMPLYLDQSNNTVYPEGTTEFTPKNAWNASSYNVSTGYFRTAGTRLLAGREFTTQDVHGKPYVAVVNRTFARTVTGNENAVGRHFRIFGGAASAEIVGVVEDGKYQSLTEAPKLAYYMPLLQVYSPTIVVIARSRRDPNQVAGDMRQAIASLDPQLPVYGAGSLRQRLGFVYLPMHAATIALGAFGVLAIMLAITGIYGLAAYTVSRRWREIGIRMAIGARPAQVLRLIFGRTGVLVLAGAAVGLAAGAGGAKLLASVVYQANSRDPVVLIGGVGLIALIGLVAAFGPARRALRVDPVQALRAE